VASTFSPALETVDSAPPLTEHTFAQNLIQKLNLDIHETELRFLKALWQGIVLLKLPEPAEELWAQPVMFMPQLRLRHEAGVLLARDFLAD
jgi:hypothetical protein